MIIFVGDERTNHILQAFIAILVLGSENCRFQWTKTSANKRFYQNIYWNLNARRDIVLSAYWWMIRREPHPQPHLRFRRQNYYIFLNYANTTPFLTLFFLTKAKEPPQLSSQNFGETTKFGIKISESAWFFDKKNLRNTNIFCTFAPNFKGKRGLYLL